MNTEIEKLAFLPLGHPKLPSLPTRIRFWFIRKLAGKDTILLNTKINGVDLRNAKNVMMVNNIIDQRENKKNRA
jgi:hypothetical protein